MVLWPQDESALLAHLSFLLDAYTLITISGGDVDSYAMGNLSAYGSDEVQQKIRSRLPNPLQFGPLMLELSLAAWHKSKGHAVKPLEVENMPDLRVRANGLDLPLYVECKQLTSSSKNTIGRQVKEANRQIRSVTEKSYGVAVLQFAHLATTGVFSDDSPSSIVAAASLVQRALSGPKNRAIGAAILTWDDYLVLGSPPERTALFLRRHFLRVDHTDDGVRRMPPDAELFEGSTVALALEWDPTLNTVDRISLTDFAKQCQQWFSLSDDDIVATFRQRQRVQRFALGAEGDAIFFATQLRWRGEMSWVVAAAFRNEARAAVQFAIRFPTELNQTVSLLAPVEMLAALVQSFGIPVVVGGQETMFIFQQTFRVGKDGAPIGVRKRPYHPAFQCLLVKPRPEGDLIVLDCLLAFAIDLGVLRGALGIIEK